MGAAATRSDAPTPFALPDNLVSVGDVLFDSGFFETASALFPALTFHVIGAGRAG